MKFAIGTLRTPKIDGVKEGVSACPYFAAERKANAIEFVAENVSSDITHMPTTLDDVFLGAANRAANLKKKGIVADYYVGIEGGMTKFGGTAYLFGVVYVENTAGEGHFGISPIVEVPKVCERMIYGEGKELGPIMEELSGVLDIRSINGSMGAWTDDMFTRKDEFVLAFKAAIAPFYNKYYKLP